MDKTERKMTKIARELNKLTDTDDEGGRNRDGGVRFYPSGAGTIPAPRGAAAGRIKDRQGSCGARAASLETKGYLIAGTIQRTKEVSFCMRQKRRKG